MCLHVLKYSGEHFYSLENLPKTKGLCMPAWRSISENIHTRCVLMTILKNSSQRLHNDLSTSYNCS